MKALLAFGVLAVIGGLMSLSQATMGVGLLAFGCFLAIAGRVVQAEKHHQDLTLWAIKMTTQDVTRGQR